MLFLSRKHHFDVSRRPGIALIHIRVDDFEALELGSERFTERELAGILGVYVAIPAGERFDILNSEHVFTIVRIVSKVVLS